MALYVLLCRVIIMKSKTIFIKLLAIVLCLSICVLIGGCAGEKQVKTQLVKDDVLGESYYKLGDYVGDYTVTDVNDNTYTFSQLLAEKKAIVLNFWFINCGPCQMEFPYLQKAYDQYKDDIAVIAINPIDAKEKDIQKYASNNSLSLPMVKGDNAWVNALSLRGFPTTVVIDCYGRVAFYHTGSITEDGVFEKLFSFFVDDSYEKATINNIEDIK